MTNPFVLSNESRCECSLSEYAASEEEAQSSSTNSSTVGGNATQCKEEPNGNPCDLNDILITETSASGSKTYTWSESVSKWVEKKSTFDKQRKISLFGVSGAQIERTLEVTAGKKDSNILHPTTIEVFVQPSHLCDNSIHPRITLNPYGNAPIQQFIGLNEAETIDFQVWRPPYGYEIDPTGTLEALLSPYWPMNVSPAHFTLDIFVCPWLNTGTPKASSQESFTILAYPADTYTFTLNIPPFKKTSHEKEGAITYSEQSGIKGFDYSTSSKKSKTTRWTQETSQEKSSTHRIGGKDLLDVQSSSRSRTHSDGLKETSTRSQGTKNGEEYYGESVALHYRDEVLTYSDATDQERKIILSPQDPTKLSVELTRNGVADSTAHNLSKIIFQLKHMEYTFKEALNALNNIGQVGWKFTLDVSFFSGIIYFTWGFKEHTDNRVFFAYSGGLKVNLVEAAGSLSFGIQISSVAKAAITLTLGGKISMIGEVLCDSPDADGTIDAGEIGPEGEVTWNGNGNAEAGIACWRVKREVGIKGAFTAKGTLNITKNDGVYIDYEISMNPIVLYTISIDLDGETDEKDYPLMDNPIEIAKGKFPQAKKEDPVADAMQKGLVKTG